RKDGLFRLHLHCPPRRKPRSTMARLTLPDGSVKEYAQPVTPAQVAADIGAGLAKAAIGARIDDQLWDLSRPVARDARVQIITKPRLDKDNKTRGEHNPDALYLLRHSTAHV